MIHFGQPSCPGAVQIFYKVLLYTNICVRYVTETVLNIRYSPVIVVFLTFNPLFDANVLNQINYMISSLL